MRSRHFGITDNYIRGSRCHVCRIPRDHEGNCPHQMRETELSKHGMARGLPFCSPWNKKDSPLFSGLDLPQVLICLRMRSSLRCRLLMSLKTLLSGAVTSQMMNLLFTRRHFLSLSEKSSFVHDHFIYFPDTVLQRIYPIVGTVDLGAGFFQ